MEYTVLAVTVFLGNASIKGARGYLVCLGWIFFFFFLFFRLAYQLWNLEQAFFFFFLFIRLAYQLWNLEQAFFFLFLL